MQKKQFLLFLLMLSIVFILGGGSDCLAGPAYKRFVFNNPANQNWRDGIILYLETDTERCKKAYGEQWPSQCEAPWPGKEGSRVEGITMTPKENGVWRWISESSLKFIPEKHLTPNTRYTISLANVEMSTRIQAAKQ